MTPTVSIAAPMRHVPCADTAHEMLAFASRILESLADELGTHSVLSGPHVRRIAAAHGADVLVGAAASRAMAAGASPTALFAAAVTTGRDTLGAAHRGLLEGVAADIGASLAEDMRESAAAGLPSEPEIWFRDLVRDVAVRLPAEERRFLGPWAAAFATAAERV